jgi:hypothetical protein
MLRESREDFLANTRHCHQLLNGKKRATLLTIGENALCKYRANAGNARECSSTGGVEVNPGRGRGRWRLLSLGDNDWDFHIPSFSSNYKASGKSQGNNRKSLKVSVMKPCS